MSRCESIHFLVVATSCFGLGGIGLGGYIGIDSIFLSDVPLSVVNVTCEGNGEYQKDYLPDNATGVYIEIQESEGNEFRFVRDDNVGIGGHS